MVALIKEVSVARMKNGAHYDFMKAAWESATADAAVSEQAQAQCALLEKKLANENECLAISRKNAKSDDIAEADRKRDDYYTTYRNALKSFLGMPEGDMLEAAKKLWQHAKDLQIDVRAQLNDETGRLTNLTEDLTGDMAASVATVGLTQLVASLKEANDTVHDLMRQRDAEESTKIAGALKAARQETDEAYGNLVQRVNALAVVDGDHDYTAFIDTMNQQIVRYRQQALAGKKKKTDETKKE